MLIGQLFFLLRNIPRVQEIVVSSGGYWSFLPAFIGKLFGKRVFIVLNGADCASIKSLDYGSLRKSLLRKVCGYTYQLATRLLPVSASLISVRNLYDPDIDGVDQGYKVFFPRLKTPATIIHNGLDENYWCVDPDERKEDNSFISAFAASQFYLKGGDLIVDLARKLPECRFRIAGMDKPEFVEDAPTNLEFLGYLTPETLRHYYRISRFHFQLSIFEGFGCSLCEAMLCECIPIVSSANMLPEIVSNTGYVVSKRDLNELYECVTTALQYKDKRDMGSKARNRVVNNYSIGHRKDAFRKLLENISE